MDWSKIKTVMIVMLLAVNAYLLYGFLNDVSDKVSPDLIENTMELCAKYNVVFPESLIERRQNNVKAISLDNSAEGLDKCAETLFGVENISADTENGYYVSEGGGYLSFNTADGFYFCGTFEKFDIQSIMNLLSKSGFGSGFDIDSYSGNEGAELKVYTLVPKIGGRRIFEHFVTVMINGSEVTIRSDYSPYITEMENSIIRQPYSMIADFAVSRKETSDTIEISDLELGYVENENGGFVPAWKITFGAIGDVAFIDAVSGENIGTDH